MSVFTNPSSSSREQAAAYTSAVLGLVGREDPMSVLTSTSRKLRDAVAGLTAEQLRTAESPGKWCVAAVARHLADSEIVWGWRMRLVLAQDEPQITGYDQDAWAERLGYMQADAHEAVEEFGTLRSGNLRLLRGCSPQDMERFGVHSERGRESIGHMMRLYAGHDILHLNQIARIRTSLS